MNSSSQKILTYLQVSAISFFCVFAFSPVSAKAADQLPKPGAYITKGGAGTLVIQQDRSGRLTFKLNSVGSNCHTCNLDGVIQNGKATLKTDESKPCVVIFKQTNDGIEVTSGPCGSYFCGANAFFEDTYFKTVQGCDPPTVQRTRKEFKKLYDAKNYKDARTKLEPLLKDCSKTLYWIDDADIRNDLAITLYKLGDLDGCRNILSPIDSEEVMVDNYLSGPCDAENIIRVMKATRTNLGLCTAGCDAATLKGIRKDFKALYDQKNYKDACLKLEPVLKNCTKTLDIINEIQIRNDLAITMYKLGDLEGCRAVLKPVSDQDALEGKHALSDADTDKLEALMKTTLANLKLCTEPKNKQKTK